MVWNIRHALVQGDRHLRREQRGLGEGEIGDRLVEEETACRLYAVVAVAEVDLVAVQREDLFLREISLDLKSQDDLLGLPRVGLLRCQEEQPRKLHGESGEAFGPAPLAEIGEQSSRNPPWVDAEVTPEVGVLDGDDGVAKRRRDVLEAHDHAALDLIRRDQLKSEMFLSHFFPLSEGNKAFELLDVYGDGVIKPVIEL